MAKYLTIGLLILLSSGLWGQKSRTKLEKERKQILQQIDLTSKLLDQTKEDKKPSINSELEDFDLKIDTFGQLQTSYNIDKINEFLNKNVDDKKLRDRDDIDKGES